MVALKTATDLDHHRINEIRDQKKDYARPIIFPLMFFRDRMQIFQNKRKLKGQKESISENLMALRYGTLKAAK